MNENSVITAAQMITKIFSNVEAGSLEKGNQIINTWRKTVESVKPDGNKLAAHSKIIDLKNEILLIETDHPGWIQLFKMHEKYILNGLKKLNKNIEIKSLAFRLEGSSAQLTDREEFEKSEARKFNEKLEKSEEQMKKMGFEYEKSGKTEELPQNLKDIFERMKSDMLTNNK